LLDISDSQFIENTINIKYPPPFANVISSVVELSVTINGKTFLGNGFNALSMKNLQNAFISAQKGSKIYFNYAIVKSKLGKKKIDINGYFIKQSNKNQDIELRKKEGCSG
jgi:hypothetical protein